MISKKEPARYCEKGERRIFAGLHSAQATSDKATAIMSSHVAKHCEINSAQAHVVVVLAQRTFTCKYATRINPHIQYNTYHHFPQAHATHATHKHNKHATRTRHDL